jgi:hypothetical protein
MTNNLKIKANTAIKTDLFWDLTPCSPAKAHDISEKNVTSNKQACLLSDPENGGSTFLRNVG